MKLLFENWRKFLVEEPEDDDPTSEEGQLAMLALHDDEAYRNMAMDLFRSSEHLDLDLLATELDDRLYTAYDKYERDAAALRGVGLGDDPWGVLMDWIGYLKLAEDFISGGGINKELRLSQDTYKLGSIKDTIARELRRTTTALRKKQKEKTDETFI